MLVDAGFNDLARPAMYGASIKITVHSADGECAASPCQGALCRASDGGEVSTRICRRRNRRFTGVFTMLGRGASMSIELTIHEPLLPEVLVNGDDMKLIRRRQTGKNYWH